MIQDKLKIVITKVPGIDVNFSFEHTKCQVEYDGANTYVIKTDRDNQVLINDTLKISFSGKRQLIDQGQDHHNILWKIDELYANDIDMFHYINKITSCYHHNFNGFGDNTTMTMPLNEEIGIDGILTIELVLPIMAWISIMQLGLEI